MKEQCFGDCLKKLRENMGMTLQELSIRSGIHQSTISRLENDPRRRPHIETFIQLARGFGVSIQEFAVLTEVVSPEITEESMVYDELWIQNFHLLTRQNLCLLNELHDLDVIAKNYIIDCVRGLKKIITNSEPQYEG